jgi:hypothetical protein
MVDTKKVRGAARKAAAKKAPGGRPAGANKAKPADKTKKSAIGMPSTRAARDATVAGDPGDPKRVIATVAFQSDGGIAWVDYTDGPYLTEPLVDFSAGEEIVFSDPQWDVKSLVNLSTYALLRLRKTDGSMFFCVIKPPRWW